MNSSIEKEKQQAREKYGPFNSTHEIYGVLKEEVEEFWDLVKKPNFSRDKYAGSHKFKIEQMIHGLTQIAAIAQRAIDELYYGLQD
jgi:hypothetical protein